MRKAINASITALVSLLSLSVAAEDLTPKEVSIKFKELSGWSAKMRSVEDAPIDGFYQVVTDSRIFYVSKDGTKMFGGSLYDFDKNFFNHTEKRLKDDRKELLTTKGADYIEFTAREERTVVYAFTDPTCGYCKKLHAQVDDYNELGITIRYLAYPRNGKGSQAFAMLNSSWCSETPKDSLHDLMNAKHSGQSTCDSDAVARHYDLGQQLGVRGTPALYWADGSKIKGGYKPPAELQRLAMSK
ncbi:DsbC family protein [Neiella marina]|uniref:Thiol:disulfide interchange protein n=1 Tax=Neiella holothuriorum TaxID=2870530 RepID=A0ABS7EGC0_9GAMM|nr:DsbC family protein [Neiella holothuriorum]MBW8191310.1 DsbC family protein [Neiella holothuriorum]